MGELRDPVKSDSAVSWIDRPIIMTWPGRLWAVAVLVVPDILHSEAPALWASPWMRGAYYFLAAALLLLLMAMVGIPRERIVKTSAIYICGLAAFTLAMAYLPHPWGLAALGAGLIIALWLERRERRDAAGRALYLRLQ